MVSGRWRAIGGMRERVAGVYTLFSGQSGVISVGGWVVNGEW